MVPAYLIQKNYSPVPASSTNIFILQANDKSSQSCLTPSPVVLFDLINTIPSAQGHEMALKNEGRWKPALIFLRPHFPNYGVIVNLPLLSLAITLFAASLSVTLTKLLGLLDQALAGVNLPVDTFRPYRTGRLCCRSS